MRSKIVHGRNTFRHQMHVLRNLEFLYDNHKAQVSDRFYIVSQICNMTSKTCEYYYYYLGRRLSDLIVNSLRQAEDLSKFSILNKLMLS